MAAGGTLGGFKIRGSRENPYFMKPIYMRFGTKQMRGSWYNNCLKLHDTVLETKNICTEINPTV